MPLRADSLRWNLALQNNYFSLSRDHRHAMFMKHGADQYLLYNIGCHRPKDGLNYIACLQEGKELHQLNARERNTKLNGAIY